ncbi:hypothetical protein [Methylovorus mays]|uniref:hypothetical protein n=1 Tax=Methylovorus mays TaxID=184077 RepID=UPI001E43242C|nr:hypothetical protein [Methylovorus mays]MCB5207713.1 hypothetical protein [Methylovorus mays]
MKKETAYEMDAEFGTGTDRHWYKYRAGTRVPTKATLAAVERVCPGSRSVFDQGPGGVRLWQALASPHIELWDLIDLSFPKLQELRRVGLAGIAQYAIEFERRLIPQQYKSKLDYIDHAKGLQRNAIYLAHTTEEISLTPEIAVSVIAFWRLCSLVLFNMLSADYLLSGVMAAMSHGEIFGPEIDELLRKYLNDQLREEYPVDHNLKDAYSLSSDNPMTGF